MDEKHLKEVHTCVRKEQANMDTPSNGAVCGETSVGDVNVQRQRRVSLMTSSLSIDEIRRLM